MLPFLGLLSLLVLGGLSLVSNNAFRALAFCLGGYGLMLLTGGVQALFRIKDIRATCCAIPNHPASSHSWCRIPGRSDSLARPLQWSQFRLRRHVAQVWVRGEKMGSPSPRTINRKPPHLTRQSAIVQGKGVSTFST